MSSEPVNNIGNRSESPQHTNDASETSPQPVNDAQEPSGNPQTPNRSLPSTFRSVSPQELEAICDVELADEIKATVSDREEILMNILAINGIKREDRKKELEKSLRKMVETLEYLIALEKIRLRREQENLEHWREEICNPHPADIVWSRHDFLPGLESRVERVWVGIEEDERDLKVYEDVLKALENDPTLMYSVAFQGGKPEFTTYPGRGWLSFQKVHHDVGKTTDMPKEETLAEMSSLSLEKKPSGPKEPEDAPKEENRGNDAGHLGQID